MIKKIKKLLIYICFLLILAVIYYKVHALFFLPEKELSIISYQNLTDIPNKDDETSQHMFHSQINDFISNGFIAITPKMLREYKSWGKEIPNNSLMLIIESIDANTIYYGASILNNYKLSATVCIPENQFHKLSNCETNSLASKDVLLKYQKSGTYNFGLKLSSLDTTKDTLKNIKKRFKEIFGVNPQVVVFPKETTEEDAKRICSVLNTKIGCFPDDENNCLLNSDTNLQFLPKQNVVGSRLIFSVKAIRHPGASSAGNIFIGQPIGKRFKASVSIFDKKFNRIHIENFDGLPTENTLLCKLPKKVDFPINVYITDTTGIILYENVFFNRYNMEKGEPIPWELRISEELREALSEIDIPPDVE